MAPNSGGIFYDLDLSEFNQRTDQDYLVTQAQRVINADSDYKMLPARQWIENMLYFGGLRNLYGAGGRSTVVGNQLGPAFGNSGDRVKRRRARNIPKLFKACQVVASNLTRNKPSIKAYPLSEQSEHDKAAKLANIVLDYLWETDHESEMNYEAVLWSLLTPLVARKDMIDFSFNKSRMQPALRKVIDPNTGQPVEIPAIDAQGRPIFEQMPWVKSELIPSFRWGCNPNATWYKDLDYCWDITVVRYDEIEQNFDQKMDGYFPENLEKVRSRKGIKGLTPLMALEEAAKSLMFGGMRYSQSVNYGDVYMRDGVLRFNLFTKPCPDWPMGREINMANGVIVYDGNSRAYRDNPTTWHPYSLLCYEKMPDRIWGITYAEKLTNLESNYEQARSEVDQLRRTYAKPKMLLPTGSTIEPDTVTGDEQIYHYNPWGADGGKPSFLTPPQPNMVIIDDLKMMSSEFTEISGVTEIMQGIRPQGVTTYRGLEILREESNNVQAPFINRFEDFIQRGQNNKLEVIRNCLVQPSGDLLNAVRVFKKMNNYVLDVDIQEFMGKDLQAKIVIEPLSSVSKSKLAQQEKLMSMAQMGALGDIVHDPDLNTEFKQKMDVYGFDMPQNKQVLFAKYENRQMLQAEDMKQLIVPPVQQWHDDVLHIRECDNLLLDPSLQHKPFIMNSVLQHRELHMQQQAFKMAEQMKTQAMLQSMQAPQVEGNNEGGRGKDLNNKGNVNKITESGQSGNDMLFGENSGQVQNQGI